MSNENGPPGGQPATGGRLRIRTIMVILSVTVAPIMCLGGLVRLRIERLGTIDRDVGQRIRSANTLFVRFHGLGAPPAGHLFVIKNKSVILDLADSFRAKQIELHDKGGFVPACGFLVALSSGPDPIVTILGDSSSVYYRSPSARERTMVVSIDPEFSVVLKRYFGVELWEVAENPASARVSP